MLDKLEQSDPTSLLPPLSARAAENTLVIKLILVLWSAGAADSLDAVHQLPQGDLFGGGQCTEPFFIFSFIEV